MHGNLPKILLIFLIWTLATVIKCANCTNKIVIGLNNTLYYK